MRVGLSLLTLVPGISGGSETYARGLAAGLGRVGMNDYVVLAPGLAPDAGAGLPTTVATGYPSSRGAAGRTRSLARAVIRPGALAGALTSVDVVHFPLTVPAPRVSGPTVVTLHDVQHHDLPGFFSRSERLYRRLAYDRAARRATRVVVISEWARRRAIDALGLDPERTHAIPLGIDHDRFRPDPSVEREPFLLYPARPWPHKNHPALFEAFAQVRRERPELRLVLTGEGHDLASLPPGVESRGSVPLDELVELYRRASLLVFPSLYEGFGLPPLEAMACGCPVASSSAASLPEVCGGAAVLFDPARATSIARGILEALEAAPELSKAGPARAASFTWEATARAHDAVYAEAAEAG